MRHLKTGRKFGRERDQRRAFMKSLASSFFIMGKIRTTEARAKELRPVVEKYLTRAKKETLHNQRLLHEIFSDHVIKKILIHAREMSARHGGYTRIIKYGIRKSDSAKMAILELVK